MLTYSLWKGCKSPEVLCSQSVEGAGRDNVKEAFPQLLQRLFLAAYHPVMGIFPHILVDVSARNLRTTIHNADKSNDHKQLGMYLHISTPLDEFNTSSSFLNTKVNGEGQVQCLCIRDMLNLAIENAIKCTGFFLTAHPNGDIWDI